jgi:hypothetical protein
LGAGIACRHGWPGSTGEPVEGSTTSTAPGRRRQLQGDVDLVIVVTDDDRRDIDLAERANPPG